MSELKWVACRVCRPNMQSSLLDVAAVRAMEIASEAGGSTRQTSVPDSESPVEIIHTGGHDIKSSWMEMSRVQ